MIQHDRIAGRSWRLARSVRAPISSPLNDMKSDGELPGTTKRIFVFGYFGHRNVGDDAICLAILEEIHRIMPRARIVIPVVDNTFLPASYSDLASTCRWRIWDIATEITWCDTLVFAGGTHISDDGDIPLRRTRAFLATLCLTLWVKLVRIRIAHFSIDVGPLDSGLTRLIASVALRFADSASARPWRKWNEDYQGGIRLAKGSGPIGVGI